MLEKRIVVVGCGRLGASIANDLYEQGEDVIVIDKNEDSFRKLSDSFGGLTYVNEGTRVETYEQLEMKKDDILIVVTNDDNVNIMISQLVRKLFQIHTIICRLYDPQRECVYQEFGIETICPTYLSVNRIENILIEKGVHSL
ncbi:MAG: potassium channel family protein [Faecalibacillus sp.]